MKTYGILPMAGKGSRIQPIAFSKELYPVAYKNQHFAISEFSIRAMMRAEVDEIKVIIRPEKLDIISYYAKYDKAPLSFYVHQPTVSYSLPESSLYPIDSLHEDDLCLFGLPDTIFSPNDGFKKIKKNLTNGSDIALGLFKVQDGSKYDSVSLNINNIVTGVKVKQSPPLSNWIWGIWGAKVSALKILKKEIAKQNVQKESERLLGVGFDRMTKLNSITISGIKLGSEYFDVGTMDAVVRIQSLIDNFEF